MPRSTVVLNLMQAGAFGFGAHWASTRLTWLAALCGLAALAQLAAGAGVVVGKGLPLTRVAGLLGLLTSAVLVGLYLQLGLHIENTFAEAGQELGWGIVGEGLLVVPWGAAIPLWQVGTKGRAGLPAGAVALLVMLLPAGWSAATWPEPEPRAAIDGEAAAAWLEGRWRGQEVGPPPDGGGPVELFATPIGGARPGGTAHVVADDLATALHELEGRLQPHESLLLEHVTATRDLTRPWLAPEHLAILDPGREVPVKKEMLSPRAWWLAEKTGLRWRRLSAGQYVPMAPRQGAVTAARVQGWIARGGEVAALDRGWTASEELTERSIVASIRKAALHLVTNMNGEGRFTYVVAGPSGKRKKGYNYPRHAGTTWFLARAAVRTGDPVITEGAERAIAYIDRSLQQTAEGGSYVLDPGRKDGLAWSGTTGLALLAYTELGGHEENAQRMATWLASAVDDVGVFRGNFDREANAWPEQPEITYAQGQGLLALAAAERAGHTGIGDALDRAGGYVDSGDYMPTHARHLGTLDDHWMCLAASAVGEVRDTPHGEDVCRAYLHGKGAPHLGGPTEPSAGASAAIAEAEISLAEIERRRGIVAGPHDRSVAWGRYLLSQQYRAPDAPFLGTPGNLIGGFRDRPWKLDVRIDAVQHIAAALMGVEQLLAGEQLPGAMP